MLEQVEDIVAVVLGFFLGYLHVLPFDAFCAQLGDVVWLALAVHLIFGSLLFLGFFLHLLWLPTVDAPHHTLTGLVCVVLLVLITQIFVLLSCFISFDVMFHLIRQLAIVLLLFLLPVVLLILMHLYVLHGLVAEALKCAVYVRFAA